MNAARRKSITAIATQLEHILEELEALATEERESFDNLPEGLQSTTQGEASEVAAGLLSDATEFVREAIGSLEEVL
jgi:hypothetical protein